MSRFSKLFDGLAPRDRRLLAACLSLVVGIVILLAFFGPAKGEDNPTPSSYGTGNHGAKAAYLTLGRLGYKVERWTEPLDQLAAQADGHTTLILAAPFIHDSHAQREPIAKILERGGRILAAGPSTAWILPHGSSAPLTDSAAEECNAHAVGFDPEATAERVRMRKLMRWREVVPTDRTEYACDGNAVVVRYAQGKGEVVWWADTLPFENSGITLDDNLALLLQSIGDPANTHIYWDESLHGEVPSLWTYASGTPVHLALLQVLLAGSLLLLSYGRRSGPLRADPPVSRASPVEFVRSLGGLFHKAHATHAAVEIANQHFRRQLQVQFGIASTLGAADAAQAVERRMPSAAIGLLADLESAELIAKGEITNDGKALKLVQALETHEQQLCYYGKRRSREGR